MINPDDRKAFDQQVLGVYIQALHDDLQDKLRLLRDVQETFTRLHERESPAAQIKTVRVLTTRLEQMIVINRLVRETLNELRETARHLVQELEQRKPA